jgi:hypothetical protein
MGTSILARNVTIGKYNHYVAEDENNTWEDIDHKYREVGERYHTYGSISGTIHVQRDCTEHTDMWIPWAEKLMDRVGIDINDIVHYCTLQVLSGTTRSAHRTQSRPTG